jgi:hypothetical protein
MAAPKFAPVSPIDEPRSYASPDHVPDAWMADRPAEIVGFQPVGARLGFQGPDQGFAIKIANGFRDRLHLATGEHAADVIHGCLLIGLRRASMFSRAPVVHDLTVAFTAWGFLAADAPAELIAIRTPRFDGLSHVALHYSEARALVDSFPEATLRMNPQQVAAAFPGRWRELLGV